MAPPEGASQLPALRSSSGLPALQGACSVALGTAEATAPTSSFLTSPTHSLESKVWRAHPRGPLLPAVCEEDPRVPPGPAQARPGPGRGPAGPGPPARRRRGGGGEATAGPGRDNGRGRRGPGSPRAGEGAGLGPRAPVPSPRGSGGRRGARSSFVALPPARRGRGAPRNFARRRRRRRARDEAPGPERGPQRAARPRPPPGPLPSRAVAGARRCPLAGAPGAGRAAQLERRGPDAAPPEPGAWRGGSPSARGAARRCRPSLPPPPPPPRRLQNPEVNSRRPGRFARGSAPSRSRSPEPEPQPGPARAAGRGAAAASRSRRQHSQDGRASI
ncbi:hypothetical protein R6Z07F_003332 [Ovis aries]